MMTAVHSGTVTPVVSWPTESVIVLPPTASAFLIAARTLSSDLPTVAASSLRPRRGSSLARHGAAVAGGQDDRVVLEDLDASSAAVRAPSRRRRG